ncbi:redoxin domain-containing protein [Halonotius roseus]|uniref:Redoxin domain-containing protein n=1 Tax=Halonotius roseus TaxID=2511997 RepID=A0A544QQ31_9EURY|nr:redoxin domain-containing protein [Halonotius roseus]TQQ81553.1 redoxin domain-containing protein [Halonotius roseus]
MLTVGDDAPDFAAPLVSEETEPFRFSNRRGSGPVVLAFFPAAFSTTCTAELCTFRDDLGRFTDLDATVFGISTDLPYALSRFREANSLGFDLVSDNDGAIIDAYDVAEDWDHIALPKVAQRAVFVIDAEGIVRYVWRADDPGEEPDYDEVAEAVESLD